MDNNCKKHPWMDVMKYSFPKDIIFEVDGLYDSNENCIIQKAYYNENIGDVICWGDPSYWRYVCDCNIEK